MQRVSYDRKSTDNFNHWWLSWGSGNLSPLPARIPNTPIRFWRKSMGKWAGIVQFGKARCHFAGLLLPDIDGLEFLDELKNQIGRTSLPVIMLTVREMKRSLCRQWKASARLFSQGNMTPQILRLAIHNGRTGSLALAVRTERRAISPVENLLDCFGIYTSVRDQSGRIIDFSIEYVNAAACTNKGMTQSEQIGKRLLIVAV